MENPVQTYHIHDNGGRPFMVSVYNPNDLFRARREQPLNQMVKVYCNLPHNSCTLPDVYAPNPSLTIEAAKVFIGPNPNHKMHRIYHQGVDERFLGNTILVELRCVQPHLAADQNTYIWIGNRGVLKFTTNHPIVEFESPMGNSDVPYPWAKDSIGNYYLMLDGVMLVNNDNLEEKILEDDDPYNYYYNEMCIAGQQRRSWNPSVVSKSFADFGNFYVGQTSYNLSYNPHPGENYDRLLDWNEGEITIEKINTGMILPLSRDGYIDIMTRAGKIAGFEPFAMETICNRGKTEFAVDKL